ncbi:MAG: universal stress protein [Myxococcaceae bacterium]
MASIEWKKVCCPVDFSGPSGTAMRVAADLCHRFGAELVLLYVDPQPETVLSTPPPHPAAQLAQWKRQAEELGAGRVVTARCAGEADIAIVDFAAQNGVDLLVLGTHGRVDRIGMLTGSVTEAVVRRSFCPVLAVHAEWRGAR